MSANRDTFTKEYATDEIVVEWQPSLCFHSQNCVRSLPQVFGDGRRPWITVGAASADEIEAAVARSGGATETGVVDATEASRYELRLDGHLVGLAAYRRRNGRIAFTHTEVDESCTGRGFGSRLASAALDDVRRKGLAVVSLCPFIAHYIDRHPEYEGAPRCRLPRSLILPLTKELTWKTNGFTTASSSLSPRSTSCTTAAAKAA